MAYETWKFNPTFTIIPILRQINPIPHTDTYFIKMHPSHLYLGLPKSLFPVGLPVKILKALSCFILATLPAQFNILQLITLTKICER